MAWIKLDDGFFRHPKALKAGRDGRILFIAGLCYAGSGLTDGFIPDGALPLLWAETGIAKPKAAVLDLINAGLWHPCPGGFQIHDYLKYNSSSDKVQSEREAAKERMAARRSPEVRPNNPRTSENVPQPEEKQKRRETKEEENPPNPPEGEGVGGTPKTPSEDPPKTKPKQRTEPNYSPEFEAFWCRYPRGHGNKVKAFAEWKLVPDQERAAVVDGLDRWIDSDRWIRGYVKLAELWIRDRMWADEPPPPKPTLVAINGRAPNGPNYAEIAKQLRAQEAIGT
jgi:hypothetical protein